MGQEYRERLAKNISKFRVAKNLKREELSLALGFDNSYISKVEKCNVNITIDRIASIAIYFGIDILELFKVIR